ncbi:hypothetical protein [Chlamydiifrater volucris]|uniref:hypothetical protein n=1 Tax=Chlamydiifrater volucris TaxID=2681470 RepID=UPI001BCB64C6|nr:hypothetical protein [Chlamydiifrater volucris]
MSVSKTHDPQKALLPLSLEDRISLNLEIIKDLARNPTFLPKPVDYDPNREILRGQMFSIMAKGVSISQLARAMAISNIYLQTIVKEGKALSKSQYDLVLASCRDLSEASGSRDLQPMPSLSPSPPQISEPPLGKEGEEEPKEAPPVPLKKRKTWRLLFMETAVESEPSTTQQISKQMEELSASLKVLLDTVLINKGKQGSLFVKCPYRGSNEKHTCPTCKLTFSLIRLRKSHLLQQTEALLEHTSKEILLKAFVDLVEKKELFFSETKMSFSHLELAYISFECRIGEEIKLPNQKNPSEEVDLYRTMESVIRSGLNHPLTRTIKELWESDSPVFPREEPILIEEGDKSLVRATIDYLSPIFSSITQRRSQSKGRKGCQHGMSPTFSKMLSDLTLSSLQALKNSSLGAAFLTQTPSGDTVIPKQILKHVYGLILSAHPSWKVEVTPCKIAFGAKETLSLPEDSIHELLPGLRKFITLNSAQPTRIPYFRELPMRAKPKAQTSETIDIQRVQHMLAKAISLTQEEGEELQESEERVASKKHAQKTRHTETPPSFAKETHGKEETKKISESLQLLLDSVLQNKDQEYVLIKCPKITEHSYGSTCFLCLLAYQVLAERRSQLVKQLEKLLEYTTKEKLLQSLTDLFSPESLTNLHKKKNFSNFELACIIKHCGIGNEVCDLHQLNPGSQVELYCALSKVIQQGIGSPLTQAILEIWEEDLPLTYSKQKDLLYTPIMKSDGSVQNCTYDYLKSKLSLVHQRLFSQCLKKLQKRRKILDHIPTPYLRFVINLSLFTTKALRDSSLGIPFLNQSPQGPVLPESVLEHIYCLILLSNPVRRVVVAPCKLPMEELEEFFFPEEEANVLYEKLLKFARINKFFLAGSSHFSVAKNQPKGEEDE